MNQIEQVSREMSKRAEMAKLNMAKLNRGREHTKGGGGGEIQDRKKSKKKDIALARRHKNPKAKKEATYAIFISYTFISMS